MEKLVYQSIRKHRIIAIKDLLLKNNIPVTSIKIHLGVELYKTSLMPSGTRIAEGERCDEINVPIEEFDEKLNDAQTFELYTDSQYEEAAIELIEKCDDETFFDDCIFKSKNYDTAFELHLMLNRNNIQCDDVGVVFLEDDSEEYLLFVAPDDKETAIYLIEHGNKPETSNYEKQRELSNIEYHENNSVNRNELFNTEHREKNIFKYILPLIIILGVLFFKIDNEFIIEIIIRKIEIIINEYIMKN
ncbi:MAG: hypothetical protein LBI28_05220 [Treponema sp.]|jgi:hypothetical protein|nr:hypothetical protein [Treponema sp.]